MARTIIVDIVIMGRRQFMNRIAPFEELSLAAFPLEIPNSKPAPKKINFLPRIFYLALGIFMKGFKKCSAKTAFSKNAMI